jgi:hypothetical protein
MTNKAKQIVESIKQACNVFAAMELPMAERECTLSYDAAMTLVKELETIQRERDAAFSELERRDREKGCVTCALYKPRHYTQICKTCKKCDKWQWRGMKGE